MVRKVTYTLDDETVARIERLAEELLVSKTEVVRQAVATFLATAAMAGRSVEKMLAAMRQRYAGKPSCGSSCRPTPTPSTRSPSCRSTAPRSRSGSFARSPPCRRREPITWSSTWRSSSRTSRRRCSGRPACSLALAGRDASLAGEARGDRARAQRLGARSGDHRKLEPADA